MNASEEQLVSEYCTVFFYLNVLLRLFCIINTLHVGVDYWRGGHFVWGVIANIGGVAPPAPPTKSVYVGTNDLKNKSPDMLAQSVVNLGNAIKGGLNLKMVSLKQCLITARVLMQTIQN